MTRRIRSSCMPDITVAISAASSTTRQIIYLPDERRSPRRCKTGPKVRPIRRRAQAGAQEAVAVRRPVERIAELRSAPQKVHASPPSREITAMSSSRAGRWPAGELRPSHPSERSELLPNKPTRSLIIYAERRQSGVQYQVDRAGSDRVHRHQQCAVCAMRRRPDIAGITRRHPVAPAARRKTTTASGVVLRERRPRTPITSFATRATDATAMVRAMSAGGI